MGGSVTGGGGLGWVMSIGLLSEGHYVTAVEWAVDCATLPAPKTHASSAVLYLSVMCNYHGTRSWYLKLTTGTGFLRLLV